MDIIIVEDRYMNIYNKYELEMYGNAIIMS